MDTISKQSLNISWFDSLKEHCPTSYTIRMRKIDCAHCDWAFVMENQTSLSIIVDIVAAKLSYATHYDLIITPSAYPRRGNSITFVTMDPPLNSIPAVRNLNIRVDERSIIFTWQPPMDDLAVDWYEIYYQDMTLQAWQNVTTSSLIWTAVDNEPCTIYGFSIFAVIDGEQNEEASRYVNVGVETPGLIEIESIESESVIETMPSTTLQVVWHPPKNAPRCAKYYLIQFRRKHPHNGSVNNQDLNVTDTKVTIINLDACEVYYMEVRACMDDDSCGDALETELNAKGRIPTPPNMLSKSGGTSMTLKLLVKNEDIFTVCQLFVAKFVCTYQGTNNEILKVNHG